MEKSSHPKSPKKNSKVIKKISLALKRNAFSSFFRIFSKENFGEISNLRALLSNERARMISLIKEKNPPSLYFLSKILGRDFKSVRRDVTMLQHFGILKLVKTTKKGHKRSSLKPVLLTQSLQLDISF